MQYDLTNLQKKNERRLLAVAKSFLYESKRNFWSYTMKFQIRHIEIVISNAFNLNKHFLFFLFFFFLALVTWYVLNLAFF